MHRWRWVVYLSLFFAFVGCDMPPDEIIDGEAQENDIVDSDTVDTMVEDDTDTELDTETEERISMIPESSCVEAVLCIAAAPEETLSCLSGLEDDDAKAAQDLAFCVLQACPEAVSDLINFGVCLMTGCSEEAVNCVGYSFF